MDLSSKIEEYQSLIDRALREALQVERRSLAAHHGMMHYHLGWVDREFQPGSGRAGKRLRPTLCLLACEAAGGGVAMALPAAAAIEILHNFSLVHDDVEDNSGTRRGHEAVWAVWGVPQAVNVGDALFALAHRTLGRLGEEAGFPAGLVLRAIRAFDETCVALTEGQFLDMSFETHPTITIEQYLEMIEGKTAALIGLSAQLGALMARCPEHVVQRLQEFGRKLGMAFQIEDDILGIWGDEAKTGKSAASDLLERKKTLPIIYGLESAWGNQLMDVYEQPRLTPGDLDTVLRLLDRANARTQTEKMANAYLDEALEALRDSGLGARAQVLLQEFALMCTGRDR